MLGILVFAAAAALATPAPQPAGAVPAGPHFSGETTDGKTIALPESAAGRALVVIVGMTQASAKATARWSEALAAEEGARAAIYGLAVLDAVPGFARAWVKRAIVKAVGPPQPGKAGFLMTFDGRPLRAAAPAGKADDPVLYIFRPDGSLAAATRRSFSEAAVAEVERALP